MARAATTTDVFNAIAEPRRREIVDLLASGERSVNELVNAMELAQPLVSKHLRVLREVGLVAVREDGRQHLYRLNDSALQPLYAWVAPYAQKWNARLDALDNVLTHLQQEESDDRNR